MIKNVLTSIGGIEVFPIIGLILFFALFTAVLIYVARMDRDYVAEMGAMPLDGDDANATTLEGTDHA